MRSSIIALLRRTVPSPGLDSRIFSFPVARSTSATAAERPKIVAFRDWLLEESHTA